MTKEEAKELLPIIQAYTEGKTIECSVDGKFWSKTDIPKWKSGMYYRIKPEQKYRAFESQEECWDEMMKHEPFGWVKSPEGELFCIERVFAKGIAYKYSCREFDEYLEDNYTFKDGTPFGIKK